ncbi:MAG: lytic transglycosylase domain-containing protein [Planctomycetota bacterium]|nr:lytic transglycosylase domain-containing protein [Planctomycetota bacterium]
MSAPRGVRPLVAALLLVAALIVGSWLGRSQALRPPALEDHASLIDHAAAAAGLEPALVRAVVAAESGGRAGVTSTAGAVGLMQLMPETAREEAVRRGTADYTDERLREPELNLELGCAYLARLLARFDGELAFALAAYNAGPTRVLRWRAAAPDTDALGVIEREGFPETRRYVRRVLRFRAAYAAR